MVVYQVKIRYFEGNDEILATYHTELEAVKYALEEYQNGWAGPNVNIIEVKEVNVN